MAYPNGGVPVWFGAGRQNDVELLIAWRDAPLTYSPDQELDSNWYADRYEIILGKDQSGELFRRAAGLLRKNQFYPPEVLTATSIFGLAGRPVQPGDRVIQRIRVFQIQTLPVLEVLTMNEVTQVIEEPRRVGFTYTTTAAHSEIGEWSPSILWRENGDVVLLIEVVSRARPGASQYSSRFTRKLQLRAHKIAIQNFQALVSGRPRLAPRDNAVPSLLPVGMLLLAILLLLGWFTGLFGKAVES